MSIELSRLLAQAFFAEAPQNASEAIERVLEKYEQMARARVRPVGIAAPHGPDGSWGREGLARPLIYFCDSGGSPAPKCGGIVVALFFEDKLYGLPAEAVVR